MHHPRAIGLICLLLLPCAGCQLAGLGAAVLSQQTIDPSYKGLTKQTVAIMIWIDRGTRIDWPNLQIDTAYSLQKKLQSAIDAKTPELDGVTFIDPPTVVRFQEDHPELEGRPITEIAPMLGASRVIYIEVSEFSTRPVQSIELYRGSMAGALKVVEISGGHATIGYTENQISIASPKGIPDSGRPDLNENKLYLMTIDDFTTAVAIRFVPHHEEDQQ
jgi:hypothetical protein